MKKGVRRVIRFVGSLSDGAIVGLFLAGYLARYVPPETLWWLQLIAIGLPILSVLVMGASVVVALRRRWLSFGFHLILVLLVAIRFGVPHTAQPSADAATLTVMSFNTAWGLSRPTRAMGPIVAREQPDIVALQETSLGFSKTKPFVRPVPYYASLFDSLHYQTRVPDGHSAHVSKPVLSRIPFDLLTEKSLPEGEEDNNDYVRVAFRWQGRLAVLYNVHLRTFGGQKPWEDKKIQVFSLDYWAHYLRQFREAILARAGEARIIRRRVWRETAPVILCGDFNSTPHNWVYRYLLDGLTDAFEAAGSGWGGTYHARSPLVRIDYVFVGPAWEVQSAHVPDARASDHRPVVAKLHWRP